MEREVMDAIYHAFQHWMLCACLAGLGMIAVLLFLAKVAAPAWDALRRWWSLPCIQRVIVGVCVVGLSYYGATKQGWHVAYDGGIKAGATANVVTNDTVSIHWQRDTSGGVYVPESAAVYIDYRPNTETNAEWGLLAQTTVGAWGWTGTVENATNYDYNVWAYYIPPEPVHTNGVWTYKTHFDRSGEYALPLRARVEVNGVAIATPAEKRKDAEKLPYDAEVEYLESTSSRNAYFNTGIDALSDIRAVGKFRWLSGSVGNDRYIIAQTGNKRMYFGTYRRMWMFGFNNYSQPASPLPQESVDYEFDVRWYSERPELFINGESIIAYGSQTGISNNGKMLIFSRQNNPESYSAHARIYYCQIWQNGVLVRDYIPVRKGTTGALYDKRGVGGMNGDGTARNDGLYFNHGTGNFGYGNDK